MSRLSTMMHRYSQSGIVKGIVTYLEHVDIPGPQRKMIAMAMLKALHVNAGEWNDELEEAISGAIEYVLGQVRDWAEEDLKWDSRHGGSVTPTPPPVEPPSPPPVEGTIYDHWTEGTLPDDGTLLKMGFHQGDGKWVDEGKTAWLVGHWGGVPGGYKNSKAVFVGQIGGPE